MIRNPLYKSKGDTFAEYLWSENKYVAYEFYKRASNRYERHSNNTIYGTCSSLYVAVEFTTLTEQHIIDVLCIASNKLKIYSSHDGSVDVVISAAMYYRLMQCHSLFQDVDTHVLCEFTNAGYKILSMLKRYVVDADIADFMYDCITNINLSEVSIDYIKLALKDATSWLHYYVI